MLPRNLVLIYSSLRKVVLILHCFKGKLAVILVLSGNLVVIY